MTLRHSIGAWKDLCKRYHEVWSHFWRQREQLSPPALQAHEADFLPAALALQAQPVSPMGRWVARILMALILVLLLWSTLGRIDIIVNAQGKIIPSDRTKTISAVEVASVQAIHVKEGQAVKAGDALIELDARSSNAEESKAEGEWQNAFLQAARSRALLQALQGGAAPVLPANREIAPARWRDADNQLLDEWRDFTAKRERLDGDIQRYGQALPLAAQQADSYADLARSHDVAEHAWLDKEQQKIDLEGQLRGARNQRNALLAETRKQAQDSLNEALRAMAAARQDAQRASAHGDLLRLVSPIDGTVQQLKTYTVGAAVPAAQPLMEIVPARGVVEMEAAIENKDVGFVEEGQTAAVKIDAFEYTRYGTLPAKVTHVSRDAIQDEKRGLIYTVKVELERPDITVNGRAMPLSAGMSGTVEIKTGTRRVIEYVLSPLLQHGRESLHER